MMAPFVESYVDSLQGKGSHNVLRRCYHDRHKENNSNCQDPQPMSGTLLRGGAAILGQDIDPEAAEQDVIQRALHDEVDSHNHSNSSSDQDDQFAFLVFMTIVVGMIVVCYLLCTLHLIRRCFCGHQFEDEEPTIVASDGVIINLTPGQRRAVLETIFSETSKAVTKDDIPKLEKGVSLEADGVEKEAEKDYEKVESLEIPVASSRETIEAAQQGAPDVEEPDSPPLLTPNLSLASFQEDISLKTPVTSIDSSMGVSNTATPETANRKFSAQEESPNESPTDLSLKRSTSSNDHLCLPVLSEEEECKEEETVEVSATPETAAVASVDNIAENNSVEIDYSSEEDEENLCAICLSSYQEGEVLVTSKYCSHLFHKECIFEWLEKHDVCPCCRVDMVTAGELNRAATTLVGKQRMCQAIQSRNTAAPQPTPPPSPPQGAAQRPSARRGRRVRNAFR